MYKYPVLILTASVLVLTKPVKITTMPDDPPGYRTESAVSLVDFRNLRDTIFTLKGYYLELNLTTQTGYLYARNDTVMEFGISTGTKRILDGVETKEGLFVIQSKMEKWHSRQFDSTLMLNWMGFNYGIGFHALLGNSYYRHLGVRPSSHGCVRLSREEARLIYSLIDLGTPVLVHSGHPAVKIAFADSLDDLKYYSYAELSTLLPQRYSQLYSGRYFLGNREKIVIDYSNIGHSGLPAGDSRRIPKRQITLPYYSFIEPAIPDIINTQLIRRENEPEDKDITRGIYSD